MVLCIARKKYNTNTDLYEIEVAKRQHNSFDNKSKVEIDNIVKKQLPGQVCKIYRWGGNPAYIEYYKHPEFDKCSTIVKRGR